MQKRLLSAAVCAGTVLLCIAPMNLSPYYNGQIPDHRNQYELMADALLKGQLNLDLEVDPRLAAMENPYDLTERQLQEVDYHWDHAFYDGKYYMYFGVVPVLLLFLPYKALTGTSLLTYHATQIFTAFIIIGLFCLFGFLAEKFFRKLTSAVLLTGSVLFSLLSVWYFIDAPALYCTAISSAVCFEVWSFYFWLKALYGDGTVRKTVLRAAAASLCGALTFGCRPTVALAGILALPVLLLLLKEKKLGSKAFGKLCLILLPYLIIGAFLMWYNYARFENPFEFGQSYQLTVTDQSTYGSLLSRLDFGKYFIGLGYYLTNIPLEFKPIELGILFSCPIAAFAVFAALRKKVLQYFSRSGLLFPTLTMLLAMFLIVFFISLCSPVFIPRYRMDIYWLISVLTFLFLGMENELTDKGPRFSAVVSWLMLLSVLAVAVQCLQPYDRNYTETFPTVLPALKHILTLGLV